MAIKQLSPKSTKKATKRTTKHQALSANFFRSAHKDLKVHRFAGVSLAGAKTDKTTVAVVEYYPEYRKLFLRKIHDKIKADAKHSADFHLHRILMDEEKDLAMVAVDAPLKLPKCLRCRLQCPGYEECKEPEIQWMWDMHRKRQKLKRPNKIFTPYLQRCVELFLAHELEESFFPPHAMGSNGAPHYARATFLARRLSIPMIEYFPKLSLWRIGQDMRIQKSYLRFHKHAIDSDEGREFILRQIVDREIAFIYDQDQRNMILNPSSFDAFLGALTAYLKFRGKTERRPPGFPRSESWIEFPQVRIDWD